MAWTERGKRKGAKRLPEKLRREVLKRYPYCWLRIPGVCTEKSTQVHHTVDAEDFEDPNDPEIDSLDLLVGVCKPCHTLHSARGSQKRSVRAANEWKRKPERHPGIID